MSAFDVKMQEILGNFGYIMLGFLFGFYIVRIIFKKYRNRIFAKFESQFAEVYSGPATITKQKLFAPIHKIVSADWKLKNNGLIRILEIGAGNGTNLKYFPKGSHLVIVDTNADFTPLLNASLKKYPSIHLERVVTCDAANMKQIEDGSVDAVVATLVLCSVSDVSQVLAEVRRVLAPGGKFFFLEHVLAEEGTTVNKIQRFLSRSKIWPTLNAGCHLNRETGKLVKQAGFSSLQLREVDVYSPDHIVFKLIRSHVAGIATK